MLPLLLLAGGAGVWLWRRSTTVARVALIGVLTGQLCVFAVRTRGLIPDWHNEETVGRVALGESPDSEPLNRGFATMLLDQGGPVRHSNTRNEMSKLRRELWQAHMTLGTVWAGWAGCRRPCAQDEQALRLNPDSALAHYNFAVALAEAGRVPEAIAHYEQVLRINPDSVKAHINLGIALVQTGKIKEAIAQDEQALRLQPDSPVAHNGLANALAAAGRFEEAIGHYKQALRVNPNLAETHFNLGLALEKLGRTPEAVEHYQQALRLRPTSPRPKTRSHDSETGDKSHELASQPEDDPGLPRTHQGQAPVVRRQRIDARSHLLGRKRGEKEPPDHPPAPRRWNCRCGRHTVLPPAY